jgi:exopolyphosphatase / guanosine-5'-triphosphate,3'-diphosphate pyrophosphatase
VGEILAAVDVGTNSFHLVVARFDGTSRFEVIEREKEMVRLGSGGGDLSTLEDDAIDRGVEALARFRKIAKISGARLRAVATSAVREADNAEEFLRRARDEAGVEVDVVSGVEEARLIHLGVLQALPVFEKRIIVIDIGGGSTEVVVGQRGEVLAVQSHKLGAIRMTRRFFRNDRLHPGAVDACRRHVRGTLIPISREVDKLGFEACVGASGTIGSVAAMVCAARGEEAPRTWNGYEITAAEVRKAVKRLTKAETVEKRRAIPGLDPRRADIILGGGLILDEALRLFGIEKLCISDYALREGALLDTLERTRGGTLHHLSDLRRRSVKHLAEMMDDDPGHSAKVAELALDLFDALAPDHELDDGDRELLEGAALLANVGLFVAHTKHHKHSYYVIRNSDHLLGFTDREIELMALTARYHRRGVPSAKHPEFARLAAADRDRVRAMAALLRVAIGLDRSYSGLVRGIRAERGEEEWQVELVPRPGADLALELYAADERKVLLEEVLDRPISFAVAGQEAATAAPALDEPA